MRIYVLIPLVLSFAATLSSQAETNTTTPKLSCSTFPLKKEFGKAALWDGHQIAIEPTERFDAVAEDPAQDSGDACRIRIIDRTGTQIYEDTLQSAALDEATGFDIESDGIRDVVLKENWGGAKGAGDIVVMALSPSPHVVIRLFEEEWGLDQFEKGPDGKVILWESEIADDFALAYDWPNAQRPSFQRAYRVVGGKLLDVTPEHCSEIEKGYCQELRKGLTQGDLQNLKNAHDLQDFETTEIATRAASLILQALACHRFDEAFNEIRQMWPDGDHANLIKNLQGTIKDWDCPECAKAIAGWR